MQTIYARRAVDLGTTHPNAQIVCMRLEAALNPTTIGIAAAVMKTKTMKTTMLVYRPPGAFGVAELVTGPTGATLALM
jgi:hypothetical protein